MAALERLAASAQMVHDTRAQQQQQQPQQPQQQQAPKRGGARRADVVYAEAAAPAATAARDVEGERAVYTAKLWEVVDELDDSGRFAFGKALAFEFPSLSAASPTTRALAAEEDARARSPRATAADGNKSDWVKRRAMYETAVQHKREVKADAAASSSSSAGGPGARPAPAAAAATGGSVQGTRLREERLRAKELAQQRAQQAEREKKRGRRRRRK